MSGRAAKAGSKKAGGKNSAAPRVAKPAVAREIRAGRLKPDDYARNFADIHPPLSHNEALVESERCYFCYDAPCQKACPTDIDIPLFIRQIASANPLGAASTILKANILGGMCARVCPTETLCEAACVRQTAEGKPVKIGLLQRYATDAILAQPHHPFRRASTSGKKVAVIGAGPAGLACAHRLAELGHAVTLFEARDKLGGLNEYGIAAYKTVDDFAQREVAFIVSIGGIEVKTGAVLGSTLDLGQVRRRFDAVFLGIGLGGVNRLQLRGETSLHGVCDAVDFIARLRQAPDPAKIPVGRRVVVIGGGMTAIDAAVQARRLGAEAVTIVYRRGEEAMKASLYERQLARNDGVVIQHWAVPKSLHGSDGHVRAISFNRTRLVRGRLVPSEESFKLEADMVLTAIGQILVEDGFGGAEIMALKAGRIVADGERRTSLPGVWAGGDCLYGGQDLTVSAVEDGKRAALSIDRTLQRVRAG
jgi:dihydropyrimidine dehydrogenase (NAD+) subunit PreT